MDKLKALMDQKKSQQGQQKQQWVKRGEVEAKQREEYFKKQELIDEKRRQKQIEEYNEKAKYDKDTGENVHEVYDQLVKKLKQENQRLEVQEEEERHEQQELIKDVPMPKQEVVDKLRELKQPVTLFGETDWKRYHRLQRILDNKDQIEEDIKQAEEQEQQKEQQLQQQQQEVYKSKLKNIQIDEEIINKMLERNIEVSKKDKKKNDDYVVTCIEDQEKSKSITNWINKILKEWESKLEELYDTDDKKRTFQGKQAYRTLKQCIEYVFPLKKVLRGEKILSDDILGALYQIAYYCMRKEYVRANDKYLDIAIGNAPWPMGVTQVGIHERAGRSKIFSSQIAHVLNDENQRRYLSSVKRLITIHQKLYPTVPSKMVDFKGEASFTF